MKIFGGLCFSWVDMGGFVGCYLCDLLLFFVRLFLWVVVSLNTPMWYAEPPTRSLGGKPPTGFPGGISPIVGLGEII